jgi:hypothetical protein
MSEKKSFWQQNPELFLERYCELQEMKRYYGHNLNIELARDDASHIYLEVTGAEGSNVSWVVDEKVYFNYSDYYYSNDDSDNLIWLVQALQKQKDEEEAVLTASKKWAAIKNKALDVAKSELTEEEIKILSSSKLL